MLDESEVRRLLLATAARDAAAFETLYRKSSPLLLAVALRIVGRRELAEDVLHDAYLKIWHAAASFDPAAPRPVAWMVSIVRHRAIDLVSSADQARVELLGEDSHAVLDTALGETATADELADATRRAATIRGCLEELQAPQRQALVLAYHHGLSHGELSAYLKKPLGTVKSWVRRALDNMRVCVESCLGAAR